MGASTASKLTEYFAKQICSYCLLCSHSWFSNLKNKLKHMAYSWGKDDENPYMGSIELFNKLFLKKI
jgi:hypothetical protein